MMIAAIWFRIQSLLGSPAGIPLGGVSKSDYINTHSQYALIVEGGREGSKFKE